MTLRFKILFALIVIPGVTAIVLLMWINSYVLEEIRDLNGQIQEQKARSAKLIEDTDRAWREDFIKTWVNIALDKYRGDQLADAYEYFVGKALEQEVSKGNFKSAVRLSARPFLEEREPYVDEYSAWGPTAFVQNFKFTESDWEGFRRAIKEKRAVDVGGVVYVGFFVGRVAADDPNLLLRIQLPDSPLRESEVVVPRLDLSKIKTITGVTIGVGTLILSIVILLALHSQVLKRLNFLMEGSKRIARGEYSVPVPMDKGDDEMARLVRTFNTMQLEIRSYHQEMEKKIEAAMEKLRAQERSLQVAQRLASTGTLAAGLAHEINNPLGGMQNAVRRLKKNTEDQRSVEYLDLINEGLDRIHDLMSRILDFSRKREEEPAPFDVNRALKSAADLVRYRFSAKVKLTLDLGESLPEAFGQEPAFSQVALNLLMNARDAIDAEEGEVVVKTSANDDEIIVQVTDDGMGMEEDTSARIFDPFFSTKEQGKGTGLGLSIVHNIVTAHGGEIAVFSEPGSGTTFTLTLPIHRPEQEAAE